jgi:homoserine dehydrogenase
MVELSYTDLQTGEPPTSYILSAMQIGKHVDTSNKKPVAMHFPETHALAKKTL